ncbi:MAG: twin-arginine translocase TatA/TatE family subunit [Kiritimatiellae bacterium]|nr:twin-arginine translocase TatA/TatE family subunit [Kiritimatiellia bacterium]
MAFAIVFDGVGAGEWLVLLAVLLVVVGPKRLPSAIRAFGNHYAKFRRAAESFKRQIMEMDTEFERAVNDAAREAEDAARIPDLDLSEPESAEALETPDPSGSADGHGSAESPEYPEYPGYYPESPEAEAPAGGQEAQDGPGAAEAAATPAAGAEETDGDRTA